MKEVGVKHVITIFRYNKRKNIFQTFWRIIFIILVKKCRQQRRATCEKINHYLYNFNDSLFKS